MFSFRKTFDRFRQSPAKSRRTPRSSAASFRPSLEALEDRCVPTVSFPEGGVVIPNVQVNALFLGQQWSSNAQTNIANQVVSFLNADTGPYTTFIQSMYPNVGTGTYGTMYTDRSNIPTQMNDNPTTPGGYTPLRNYIVNDILNGNLPSTNGNQLYMVYLPPGTTVTDPDGTSNVDNNGTVHFRGYHGEFTYNNQTYIYAVVVYPGGQNGYTANTGQDGANSDLDDLTAMTSHELAEAITNPTGYGWYDRVSGNEIADISNDQGVPYVKLNGFVVEPLADQNETVPPIPGATPFSPGSAAPPPAAQPPAAQPPSSQPVSSQPPLDPGLVNEISAIAMFVVQNLESGNNQAADEGLEFFMYLYDLHANDPAAPRQEMLGTFIGDVFSDL